MKTIYLIRHAAPFVEIDNYKNNIDITWLEFNQNMILSMEGEEKAKRLCKIKELTNLDCVFASGSARAIATAKYIANLNHLSIKLDKRINEREFGVKFIKELSSDIVKISFANKNFKLNDGESLNEVDKRFRSFINDLLKTNYQKIVIVMHGNILLSYLETVCQYFKYDGKNFNIKFNDKVILNGVPKNPSVFKIEFDDLNQIRDINQVFYE